MWTHTGHQSLCSSPRLSVAVVQASRAPTALPSVKQSCFPTQPSRSLRSERLALAPGGSDWVPIGTTLPHRVKMDRKSLTLLNKL